MASSRVPMILIADDEPASYLIYERALQELVGLGKVTIIYTFNKFDALHALDVLRNRIILVVVGGFHDSYGPAEMRKAFGGHMIAASNIPLHLEELVEVGMIPGGPFKMLAAVKAAEMLEQMLL